MPRAARLVHFPIFFLNIFFFSQFFFPDNFFFALLALCNYIYYSLMQPPAASMEADVKEISMLILKILLKWPIIAKHLIGFWIAASSSLHGGRGRVECAFETSGMIILSI